MTTEQTVDDVDRRVAMRIACLVVGALGILASVLLITDPATGFMAIAASAVALAIALSGSGTWEARKEWPHIIAIALAAISAFGLCSTGCGTHRLYESVLGIPTSALGMAMHGLAVLGIYWHRKMRPEEPFYSDLLICVSIAGSLFYAAILILSGTWCGVCVGIHALMAVQLIELLVNRPFLVYRTAMAAVVIAGAGGLNAIYHHRSVPAVRDDPGELLAYLRSAWTAPVPPRQIVQDTASMRPKEADSAVAPSSQAPASALLPPSAPSKDTQRAMADSNRWGSSAARVAVIVAIDPTCPHCAVQWPEILQLADLVDKGIVQVRFLIGYDNGTGQAMASIAYAAGLHSEQALLETMTAFLKYQSRIVTTADAVDVLPAIFPRDTAVAAVRTKQTEITSLLLDASRVKQSLGFTANPMIWIQVAGMQKPSRVFHGATMSSILKVAITSVAPVAPADPSTAAP